MMIAAFPSVDIDTLLIPDGYLYDQSVSIMASIANRHKLLFITPNKEDYCGHVFNGTQRDQTSLLAFIQATDKSKLLSEALLTIHDQHEYRNKIIEEMEFYKIVAKKIWNKIRLYQANIKNIVAISRGCAIAMYLADIADYSGNMFLHIPDLVDVKVRGLLLNNVQATTMRHLPLDAIHTDRVDKTVALLSKNAKRMSVIPAESYVPCEHDICKFLTS